MFLFEFEPFDKEGIDILGLFVAQVRAKIFHEFDEAMLPQILVCAKLESVLGCGRHCYVLIIDRSRSKLY